MDLASARHELLGAPLASFVVERDRLSKELQAAGKKGDADELRKLRKPAAPTWALNQVARRQPALIEALFAAGQRMAEAHQTAASSEEFRDTSAEYRRAITSVVAAARKILDVAGHATDLAAARRLERALQALPFARAEQRAAARQGDLEGEMDSGDIFDADRLQLPPTSRRGPTRTKADAPRAKADEAARHEDRQRQAKALRATALNAARAADRAAKAAESAAQAATTARGRVDSALRILRDAEHALATAKDRVDQSRKDLADAETAAATAKQAAKDAAAASSRASKAAADNDEA